jgi:hypothetical protein
MYGVGTYVYKFEELLPLHYDAEGHKINYANYANGIFRVQASSDSDQQATDLQQLYLAHDVFQSDDAPGKISMCSSRRFG